MARSSLVTCTRLALLVLAPAAGARAAGEETPAQDKANPPATIGSSVEQFLLEMRDRIRAQDGGRAAPQGEGLGAEAFRGALRRAAQTPLSPWSTDPARPAAPPAEGQAGGQQPQWVMLLDAALRLEGVAHELDLAQLWDAAANVRTASQQLRHQARELCEASRPAPPPQESPDKAPADE